MAVADDTKCTCGNAGNPTVIDGWYPSHPPWCMAWCDCRPVGAPIINNVHRTDCGIYESEK